MALISTKLPTLLPKPEESRRGQQHYPTELNRTTDHAREAVECQQRFYRASDLKLLHYPLIDEIRAELLPELKLVKSLRKSIEYWGPKLLFGN